jgi:predicted acyltransferase
MAQCEGISSAALASEAKHREAASQAVACVPASQRLVSLDALRGFAMFWLIGGRELSLGLVAILYFPLLDALDTQLTHPKWQGYVAWDLVMPVFLFLVGTSMPLAMAKRREHGSSLASSYWRIGRRVATLWILGAVAQALKYSPGDMDGMELYSNALQAIAVGYLVTAVALLNLRLQGQIVLFACLVLGYGALLMFVPFNGYPGGTVLRTANLARYVDEWVLGDFRRDHSFTWVLTSLGFAASVLMGALAGHLLRAQLSPGRRLLWLAAIGLGSMAAGWMWSYWLPFNRHLWTSSMILWAGGISFVLVALFYAVIDVAGIRRWAFPLVVIGANALLAYVLDPIFGWTSDKLVLFVNPDCPIPYFELLSALIEVTALWAVLWVLYRKRIFLRA